eukprot:m.198940 g.198940  ORF g.198940 m.198940 type:complete len:167 (+) comp13691_c1_seq1:71-571(+)
MDIDDLFEDDGGEAHVQFLAAMRRANRRQERRRNFTSQELEHLLDKQDELKGLTMMPIKLESCDGGNHSASYSARNIVKPDDEVYCSLSARNINLEFSPSGEFFERNATAFLTDVVVISPSIGFTSPLMDGIVLLSNRTITELDHKKFDDYTQEKFNAYWEEIEKG